MNFLMIVIPFHCIAVWYNTTDARTIRMGRKVHRLTKKLQPFLILTALFPFCRDGTGSVPKFPELYSCRINSRIITALIPDWTLVWNKIAISVFNKGIWHFFLFSKPFSPFLINYFNLETTVSLFSFHFEVLSLYLKFPEFRKFPEKWHLCF